MIPEEFIPHYFLGCLLYIVWIMIATSHECIGRKSRRQKRTGDLAAAIILSPFWPIALVGILFSYIQQLLREKKYFNSNSKKNSIFTYWPKTSLKSSKSAIATIVRWS